MSMIILLADANTFVGGLNNAVIDATGGDFLLVGLGFLIVVILLLMLSGARSGLAVVVGMSIVFLLSLLNPLFMALYWVGLVIAIVLTIIGMKDKGRSQ